MNPNQPVQSSSNGKQEFTDILLSVNFDTQQEVLKKETGLKLAQRIYSQQNASDKDLNFYSARSERWKELDAWATGKQDTKQFLQYMNVVDATKSYLNIDTSPIMVGAQFVSTLVTSMAKNEEYPCVTAVDDGSMTEKERRRLEAYFRMNDAQAINQAEEAAGMKFEPPNPFVPEDELSAEVYFKTEDRLPKEIKLEQKLNAALERARYSRVLKPKGMFDLIVKNFGCIKLDSDGMGGYKMRKCVPANMIYSYFQSDTGDDELGYIGDVYSLKIRDLRRNFGKYLDEKTLFKLAKSATQQNVGTNFNYEWKDAFNDYNNDRPWDDMSIPVYDFEIKITVNDYYVSKEDKMGKENISERKNKPNPKSPTAKTLFKPKERWYRGVYAIYGQEMIYWGLPDLVLFPFLDHTRGLSSYSVNIPMNMGTYTPSLFERALEPLKEYALVKLQRKKIIAKLRPSGIRIDIESARNVDLGNGQTMQWDEILRIYDTTGTEIYSSRGVNPNERENPAITPGAPSDDINKILELTNVLAGLVQEIRGLIGVPMYRDGSDVGDRTAARLAEGQTAASFNVTDHITNGWNQLMEEVLYKCCILEWQKAVKEEAAGVDPNDSEVNAQYQISVKMKPTEYQQKLLEQRILQWSQTPDAYGNPLLSPKDVYVIENIKDYKMAQRYLASVIDTNRRRAMEDKAQLDKQNQDNQIASAQAANEGAKQLEQQKADLEIAKVTAADKAKQKQTILSGVFDLLKIGAPIPQGMEPLVKLVLENHAIPLMQENKQIVQGIQQQEMEEQAAAEQEAQIMEISQQTGMPPEQVVQELQNQQQQVA
jgi:hypothetical protein